jgi:hypothetical protein
MPARLLLAIPLLVAAAPAGLRPGLWHVTSTPGQASLDGRPLGDLPYTPPTAPDAVCLTPAQARDVATWLARDVTTGCTLNRQTTARGRIAIGGTCPPQAPGLARGTVRLTGSWSPDRYSLRFATMNPGENGVMGFTGAVEAKRVGDCPA